MNNIKGTNHNHAEAFCHMQYYGKSPNGSSIHLSIWNSRDGVTPMMLISKEFGIQLQHINWRQDRYDPRYKPCKGDFIWRNYTEQEAKDLAEKQIVWWSEEKTRLEAFTDDQYKQLNPQTPFSRARLVEQLTEMLANADKHIKDTVKRLLDGQPFFELVTEDWK